MQTGLVLFDQEARQHVPARWAARLIALGARLARWPSQGGRQLAVSISVPIRDYAALLIGVGWILTKPIIPTDSTFAELETIRPHTPVRMVLTSNLLIADRFFGIDRCRAVPRIHVGKSWWQTDKITHIVADPALPESRFGKHQIPDLGSLARKAGRTQSWRADHCAGRREVSIIGTRSRLESELDLVAGWGKADCHLDRLRNVLRPDDGRSPMWASAVMSGGSGESPVVPKETRLAVLDGAIGIRWMPEMATSVVVAVIERSSTDESAISVILQTRSTARPIDLESLRWHPMPGVEALAFEVRK